GDARIGVDHEPGRRATHRSPGGKREPSVRPAYGIKGHQGAVEAVQPVALPLGQGVNAFERLARLLVHDPNPEAWALVEAAPEYGAVEVLGLGRWPCQRAPEEGKHDQPDPQHLDSLLDAEARQVSPG